MIVKVLTCRPQNHPFPLFSWLIMFFSKTNYSHYGIQIGNIVLDATSKGVRLNNTYEYKTRYKILKEYRVNLNTDLEGFLNWVSPYLNKGYGYRQAIGLLLMIKGILKRNPFGDDRFICNEMVILMLRDFKGLDVEDSDDYDLVQTEKILERYKCL